MKVALDRRRHTHFLTHRAIHISRRKSRRESLLVDEVLDAVQPSQVLLLFLDINVIWYEVGQLA